MIEYTDINVTQAGDRLTFNLVDRVGANPHIDAIICTVTVDTLFRRVIDVSNPLFLYEDFARDLGRVARAICAGYFAAKMQNLEGKK